jgi:hypothetical protein
MLNAVKDRVHKLARRANADKGLTWMQFSPTTMTMAPMAPMALTITLPSTSNRTTAMRTRIMNLPIPTATPLMRTPMPDGFMYPLSLPSATPTTGTMQEWMTLTTLALPLMKKTTLTLALPLMNDARVNDDENSEPTGVEDLEEFVDGLEAALDDEIANLDSNYDPNDSQSSGDDALVEGNFGEINQDEIDGMGADATKEQDDAPMPRLGQSRQHDDESNSDSDDKQHKAPALCYL